MEKTHKVAALICSALFSIFSYAVIAADTPPPIPVEYWGKLIIEGEPAPDGTEVSYFNGEEWITTTSINGWYSIIMDRGDSKLTYNTDADCENHSDEACIPCTQDVDCVEGPQVGDPVLLKVNGVNITVIWSEDAFSEETKFVIYGLSDSWNLRSVSTDPIANQIDQITAGLSGKIVIWNYNESGDWRVYDSTAPFEWINTLKAIEYGRAYWIKSETDQNFGFAGKTAEKKTITLKKGWNFIGFNGSITPLPDAISGLTEPIVIWGYNESGDWTVYDTEAPFPWINTLDKLRLTMGYWIKSAIDQIWEI